MSYIQIPFDARLNPKFKERVLSLLRDNSPEENVLSVCKSLSEENQKVYDSVDVSDVVHRLNMIESEIRKHLVNRRDITQQGLRALMTSEHQFIFSAAGVAKSLYARQVFSFFKHSDIFSIQFSPDTSPDDLFGAYDIEKFKKGEIYHNVEGSIITNNFAFLDEFMDGSDKLLRSLLNVLLERRFISGNQVEEALLHSAIATSNYMRVSETTEALLDRFLYKSFITPSKDMFTLLRIDKVYNDNAGLVVEPNADILVEMRELYVIKEIIRNKRSDFTIKIPIEMNYLKNLVVVAFEEEMKKYRDNYYISPRTITKSNDLMKANALLDGRMVVDKTDVEQLYYLFCTLNEPLDSDRSLLSQTLFSQVFKKRYQYFESVKEQLIPLLYIFEFMVQAQRDPKMLENSIEFIDDLAKHSVISNLFDMLKHPFMSKNEHNGLLNKSHLLEFVKSIKSSYNEINQFRDRVEIYIKEVFALLES